jgi:hypothetical protein
LKPTDDAVNNNFDIPVEEYDISDCRLIFANPHRYVVAGIYGWPHAFALDRHLNNFGVSRAQ